MSVRGWTLAADWSRFGTFDQPNEDITAPTLELPEVVVSWGRSGPAVNSGLSSGKLSFALLNMTKIYSPRNSASALAGKVGTGVPIQLQRTHLGQIYTLFSGVLDRITVENDAANTATAEVSDAWGRPSGEKLSTGVYRGVRTGDAIGVVLDEIGWTGPREIDPGATYMPFWWEEGTDAASAIQRLVDSEGPSAVAYVRGGTFVFCDRHHRIQDSRSRTSAGTYTHVEPALSGPVGEFRILKDSCVYDDGLASIANSVTFNVEQRMVGARAIVWSTEDTISLAASETLPIEISGSDPFVDAEPPSETGIGLTDEDVGDFVLLSGSLTTSLSRTSGATATLFLTAGGSGAVFTGMRVIAKPIKVARTIVVREEDAASVAGRGRQEWPGDVPWCNAYDARAVAQKILAIYSGGPETVEFDVSMHLGSGDAYATQFLERRVGDRITVRVDRFGVNGDFIIERIEHRVFKWGIKHVVRFSCQAVEPDQPSNVFTFNVAGKGFNDGYFGTDGIDNPATMFTFDVAGKGFNDGVFST